MPKPKKILYCIDTLLRGGTELQLIGMINELDRALYKPYLLTIKPCNASLVPQSCEHLAWDVPTLISIDGLNKLIKLVRCMKSEEFDVVHTFFQDSTIFGALGGKLAGIPTRIAAFRDLGFWYTKKQALLLKLVYKTMTGFISNSEIVKEHFSELFSINAEKITVIRNGIHCDRLNYHEQNQPVENIGIVGNMTRQVKRTDLFIDACALVHKHHPELKWHIIGDGHLKEPLLARATELGVEENVVFAGTVRDVQSYLKHLQIGVNCSDSEGLSNAIIEYMLTGVAAVVTDVGGNPELIEHNSNGLVVQPDNAEALAAAILRLINEPNLRMKLAQQARHDAETAFRWDICIEQHINVYNRQIKINWKIAN